MLSLTKKGLYCKAGDFYIDPSGAVDTAVVTHAHSDHARRGSKNYYCAASGEGLLKARLGQKITTSPIPYGQTFKLGPVRLSFHPAGHILGSAQVRMEYQGEVWVASGDYKREADPTCEPFEVVPCDVFVTEATFGTPAYVWPKQGDLGQQIFEWWQTNSRLGINSVLFAYSLGKTQRILGELAPLAKTPIYCHSAAAALNACYVQQGMQLASHRCLSTVTASLQGELIIAPQSFLKTEQAAAILGEKYETAFASGWMATRNPAYGGGDLDKGFVMSDHADWNDLVDTVLATKAKRVYVQHRGHGALVRYLKTKGIKAYPDTALVDDSPAQLSFL